MDLAEELWCGRQLVHTPRLDRRTLKRLGAQLPPETRFGAAPPVTPPTIRAKATSGEPTGCSGLLKTARFTGGRGVACETRVRVLYGYKLMYYGDNARASKRIIHLKTSGWCHRKLYDITSSCVSPAYYQMAVEELQRRSWRTSHRKP